MIDILLTFLFRGWGVLVHFIKTRTDVGIKGKHRTKQTKVMDIKADKFTNLRLATVITNRSTTEYNRFQYLCYVFSNGLI